MSADPSLSPEDAKLVTLARAAIARTGASAAAALRDLDGRTYVGVRVVLPSLELRGLELAVAMAISSGSRGAEAAVVVTDIADRIIDLAVLRDFAGTDVPVYVVDGAGALVAARHS